MRRRGLSTLGAVLLVALATTVFAGARKPPSDPLVLLGHSVTQGAAPGYIEDSACATCHAKIYRSYQEVGMARSFARAQPDRLSESLAGSRFYHAASKSHFEMNIRDGRLFFKRYQIDEDGVPVNVFEQAVDYVIGSGHHARSYVYRTPSGELFQLPIGWYSQTREWAMSPGFDRPRNDGVLRPVRRECLFCHNAYPDVPADSDAHWAPQTFPATLPEGIGCQRCHGPGAAHVRAALDRTSSSEAILSTIVNPKRLDSERREAVCLQCHLLAAVALPGVRRFDRDDYSFRPGEKLGDYMVHVDIDEARPAADRFEIDHQGYRLRQSRCFLESQGRLSCTTCHDPHVRIPAADRAAHYAAVCLSCHERHAPVADASVAAEDCTGCHMPKRRTQDVVHVVMTDHKIVRRGPADATAPLEESEADVRGVRLLDPATLPPGPEREASLSVAALRGRATPDALEQLREALLASPPRAITPVFDLAMGQIKLKEFAECEKTLAGILTKSPNDVLALQWTGICRVGQNKPKEAIDLFERVLKAAPDTVEAHFNLGLLLAGQGEHKRAAVHLERAVALRPNLAAGWYRLARTRAHLGRTDESVLAYRRALEIDPSYAPAYVELGQTLVERGDRAGARRTFKLGMTLAAKPEAIASALEKVGAEPGPTTAP